MSVIINPAGSTGGSATVGTATLNFGSFPSTPMASVAVTGQTAILSTSSVEAWISYTGSTSDHSSDEHLVENFRVRAGNIVPGTGFTIYGEAFSPVGGNGVPANEVYGSWVINWRWQ